MVQQEQKLSATPASGPPRKLEAPLQLLHVLEKESLPPSGDLSGTIGFGSRQRLLEQLVLLDAEKAVSAGSMARPFLLKPEILQSNQA